MLCFVELNVRFLNWVSDVSTVSLFKVTSFYNECSQGEDIVTPQTYKELNFKRYKLERVELTILQVSFRL